MRRDGHLEPIARMEGWVSPRLGIRFSLEGADLVLYRPDGRRFETFVEIEQRAEVERQRAEVERQRAEAERQRAEAERQRAEVERRQGREEGLQEGLQQGLHQALDRLIASGMTQDQAKHLLGLV